jgi:hypothetical protein
MKVREVTGDGGLRNGREFVSPGGDPALGDLPA